MGRSWRELNLLEIDIISALMHRKFELVDCHVVFVCFVCWKSDLCLETKPPLQTEKHENFQDLPIRKCLVHRPASLSGVALPSACCEAQHLVAGRDLPLAMLRAENPLHRFHV